MGVWASDISKNQIKWKPDIYFLKRKLHFFFFESLCGEIGRKLHCYMGVWASDISKNQIKWKPDIYFLKRKLPFFFESLCREIKKKEIKLIYGGLGQRHFIESDKMEA